MHLILQEDYVKHFMKNVKRVNIIYLFIINIFMKNELKLLYLSVALIVLLFILSPGTITGYLSRSGQFTVGNEPIEILALYLNDNECTDGVPTDCTITGVENSTKAVTVKVTVRDDNGNCDEFTSNNGTAYFCDGDVSICNVANAKHIVVDLEYDASDGLWGTGDIYCNLTGTPTNFQFYEVNGTYTVNVTVTDGASSEEASGPLMYYNEIRAITYPRVGTTIDMGSLNMSSWNNATGYDFIQNSGNIILNLDWNASDFTGQSHGDIFLINDTGAPGSNPNFLLDDDNDKDVDNGNLNISSISENNTLVTYFEPINGLANCSDVSCSGNNATLDIYWYLYVPSGLHGDTYTNTIEVRTSDWTSQREAGHQTLPVYNYGANN